MPDAGGAQAVAKGEKQPGVGLYANFSSDQGQRQALFLGKETEPGFSVGCDIHVRLAGKAVLDVQRSILDRDRGLALFRTGESEMEGGVEAQRLVRLEYEGHEVEQSGDTAHPETIGPTLPRFVLAFSPPTPLT